MVPEDILYTKDHEWIRIDGQEAVIGITDYAQSELGEIVFVDVQTVDETLNQGDTFGAVEAVKTVSDLFMPMGGKVLEFNDRLENEPELVNNDPYGDGWMIRVELSDLSEKDKLLDAKAYQELIG